MSIVNRAARRGTKTFRFLLLLGASALLPQVASATSWYVDGANGKAGNPGTAAAPFLYFWQGMQVAKPGDTVFLLPTIVYPHISISVSGTNAQPITVAGAGVSPQMTHIAGGNSNFAVWINANYVVVRNLDLTASGIWTALDVAENHHHITIANNVVHDAGGDGINTTGDDYVTISHNIVYGNAKNTSNNVFGSGISTLGNLDIDNNTGIKMRIDGNVVYGNTNTPNCTLASCLATATDSDGNGIIIDDLRRIQRDHIPYRGRTLITNNVVFGNGGRGIHIYSSDHVTATENTVYSNNQDPYEGYFHPGEITANFASDVAIYDNILFSDGGVGIGGGKYTGTHVPLAVDNCSGAVGVTGEFNLGFTATNNPMFYFGKANTVPVTVASNSWGNPNFVRPSLNPSLADFRVRPGSPALGAADPSTATATDFYGLPRAMPVSIGAIQNAGS